MSLMDFLRERPVAFSAGALAGSASLPSARQQGSQQRTN